MQLPNDAKDYILTGDLTMKPLITSQYYCTISAHCLYFKSCINIYTGSSGPHHKEM